MVDWSWSIFVREIFLQNDLRVNYCKHIFVCLEPPGNLFKWAIGYNCRWSSIKLYVSSSFKSKVLTLRNPCRCHRNLILCVFFINSYSLIFTVIQGRKMFSCTVAKRNSQKQHRQPAVREEIVHQPLQLHPPQKVKGVRPCHRPLSEMIGYRIAPTSISITKIPWSRYAIKYS